MSTIPTTFNETIPSYTVVGGRERLGSTGLSAVLLNRGGRFSRQGLFRDLEKTGFDTVVSMESAPISYDIDELGIRFPFVRFILLQKELSLGEQINIAASETDSPLFFVLRNDLKIIAGGTARRMAERLSVSQDNTEEKTGKNRYRRICTVPVMQNSRFETLPTLIAPVLHRRKVKTLFLNPASEGLPSLYPFDGVGIYDRDSFIQLGGFDSTFNNSYWQLMDFGFRAWLWGEEITATRTLKLSYETSVPAEDNSINADYNRFFLKNIAPVFEGDFAHLPLYRFPGHLLRSCLVRNGSGSISGAWEDFSDSCRWVTTNQFRWRCNPRAVTGRWDQIVTGEIVFSENSG